MSEPVTTEPVPTVKQTLTESIKARLMADLADLEAALGRDMSGIKAEIDALDAKSAGFFADVDAWFKRHF